MRRLATSLTLLSLVVLLTTSCDRQAPLAPGSADPAFRAAASGSSAPTALATGSGHYTFGDDVWRTFSFNAMTTSNGDATGSFQLVAHRHGQEAATYHGKVICLSVRDNQAWVGGYFTKMPNPDRVGTWLGFRAIDNGEGQGAAPDQLTRTGWAGQDPAGRDIILDHCRNQPEGQALHDVESGNIKIRG